MTRARRLLLPALIIAISEHTVKRHVHNIYEKAGVSRRDELIRMLKETE